MKNTKNSPAFAQGFGGCFAKRLLLALCFITSAHSATAYVDFGILFGFMPACITLLGGKHLSPNKSQAEIAYTDIKETKATYKRKLNERHVLTEQQCQRFNTIKETCRQAIKATKDTQKYTDDLTKNKMGAYFSLAFYAPFISMLSAMGSRSEYITRNERSAAIWITVGAIVTAGAAAYKLCKHQNKIDIDQANEQKTAYKKASTDLEALYQECNQSQTT